MHTATESTVYKKSKKAHLNKVIHTYTHSYGYSKFVYYGNQNISAFPNTLHIPHHLSLQQYSRSYVTSNK